MGIDWLFPRILIFYLLQVHKISGRTVKEICGGYCTFGIEVCCEQQSKCQGMQAVTLQISCLELAAQCGVYVFHMTYLKHQPPPFFHQLKAMAVAFVKEH